MTSTTNAPEFRIGDVVRKPKGYAFPGIVRSVFLTGANETRLVVESRLCPGLLHIFAPHQVELVVPR